MSETPTYDALVKELKFDPSGLEPDNREGRKMDHAEWLDRVLGKVYSAKRKKAQK